MRGCLLLVLFAVVGCDEVPVAQDLTQTQAREVVASLATEGISAVAERQSGGKAQYQVKLRSGSYSEAVSLMQRAGVPSQPSQTVNELLTSSGMIPNSREIEQLRVDRALAADLEETIMAHPSVAHCRAIVRLQSLKAGQEPSVTVVVRTKAGATLQGENLLNLIKKSVPGINPEQVALSIESQSSDPQWNDSKGRSGGSGVTRENGTMRNVPLVSFLYFWRVPEGDVASLSLSVLGLVALVALLALVLGYLSGSFKAAEATKRTPGENVPLPSTVSRGLELPSFTEREEP